MHGAHYMDNAGQPVPQDAKKSKLDNQLGHVQLLLLSQTYSAGSTTELSCFKTN